MKGSALVTVGAAIAVLFACTMEPRTTSAQRRRCRQHGPGAQQARRIRHPWLTSDGGSFFPTRCCSG